MTEVHKAQSCRQPHHSPLLGSHLELLKSNIKQGPIIDIACGEGRNGLFLAEQGLPVVFADRSNNALDAVTNAQAYDARRCHTWAVDLEEAGQSPLHQKVFSAAIVFRYLHRPLIPAILNAVAPNGIVIYETFTVDNTRFGRPANPDYLLQPGELRDYFKDWEIIDYFEGILSNPDRAIAHIVCRKPGNTTEK